MVVKPAMANPPGMGFPPLLVQGVWNLAVTIDSRCHDRRFMPQCGTMRIPGFLRSGWFQLHAVSAGAVICASCGQEEGESGGAEAPPEPPPAETALAAEDGAWSELSTEEKSRVVDGILQARAREQAEGLGGGSVAVNGAWHYTGYSYLSPDPNAAVEARLVAVDVTVSGHRPTFDLDDIEIVDGETLVSFGSDPHIEPLTLEGELMPPGKGPVPAPRASRYLLIYGFPKNLDEFRLFYWGQQLTVQSEKVAGSGWELPYPATGGDGEPGHNKAQPLPEDEPDAEPTTDQKLKPGEGLFSR